MVTVEDLIRLGEDFEIDTPVYVQSGYNRFKINSFVEKNGEIIFILDQDASNPTKAKV